MRNISVSVWKTETEMGTYTTNYNLFMPTVGESGWGELVNGNFATIDTTMKGLDTRITNCESQINGTYTATVTATTSQMFCFREQNLIYLLLPVNPKVRYSGTITGYTGAGNGNSSFEYISSPSATSWSRSPYCSTSTNYAPSKYCTISFTNIECLYVRTTCSYPGSMYMCTFTIT